MKLFVIACKTMPFFTLKLKMNGYNFFCSTTTNYHRPSSSLGQSESLDIRSEEPENVNNDEDEDNSAET